MLPKVAIVVVNWNGKAETMECLESLRRDAYGNKAIIVVDNGSHDDSAEVIAREFVEVALIENDSNLGFTGGNNCGIAKALAEGADYVYFVNNDTVCEPLALSILINAAESDRSFGLLTPVIHYYDDSTLTWFSGSRIDWSVGIAVHDNEFTPSRTDKIFEIPWASGCAMLIPRRVLENVGGFDDRFFLNWEDVDLSLRIRRSGGRIGLVPGARIGHKVSRSFDGMLPLHCYYHVRNNLLILRLYAGADRFRAIFAVVFTRLRESVRIIRRGDSLGWKLIAMTLRAFCDDFRGRYGRFQ